MASRYVDVLYADDIRFEKNEQISLIGIYQPTVNVPAFPHVFPKLCLWIRAKTSPGDLFKSLSVVIDDDSGKRLDSLDIPPESFAGQKQAPPVQNGDDSFIEIGIHYIISPLICHGPMFIKPSLVTERETIRGNALRIQLATQDT